MPADIDDIDADGILIEQVLLNLIRNACEAMMEIPALHRGPREIVVAVRDVQSEASALTDGRPADHVEFAVIDRGPGILPELHDKLFEPFFSTKSEGMGMGLNICRTIVEFHRGRLWASPTPGGGTIFRFTLPRAIDEAVEKFETGIADSATDEAIDAGSTATAR